MIKINYYYRKIEGQPAELMIETEGGFINEKSARRFHIPVPSNILPYEGDDDNAEG